MDAFVLKQKREFFRQNHENRTCWNESNVTNIRKNTWSRAKPNARTSKAVMQIRSTYCYVAFSSTLRFLWFPHWRGNVLLRYMLPSFTLFWKKFKFRDAAERALKKLHLRGISFCSTDFISQSRGSVMPCGVHVRFFKIKWLTHWINKNEN